MRHDDKANLKWTGRLSLLAPRQPLFLRIAQRSDHKSIPSAIYHPKTALYLPRAFLLVRLFAIGVCGIHTYSDKALPSLRNRLSLPGVREECRG